MEEPSKFFGEDMKNLLLQGKGNLVAEEAVITLCDGVADAMGNWNNFFLSFKRRILARKIGGMHLKLHKMQLIVISHFWGIKRQKCMLHKHMLFNNISE